MFLLMMKKIFDNVFTKKSGNSYLNTDLHSCKVPGQKRVKNNDNMRLLRLRQWIVARKRKTGQGYGQKTARTNLFIRIGCLLFLGISLSLFVIAGGRQRIQESFQSFSFFKTSEVIFSGCTIVSQETLRNRAAIILHQTSLIGLETAEIEAKLSKVDWVASVRVTRNWPSTITIRIKENIPVALMHIPDGSQNQLHYLDRKGKTFLSVVPGADIDFPVITGLSEVVSLEIKERSLKEVLTFLKKLRVNDPHLPAHSVSEIHVNQNGEMVVYLVEYPFPIFFGNGNTKRKYARLVQVLKALYKKKRGKELISQVEYIQMDYLYDKVLVAQSGSG